MRGNLNYQIGYIWLILDGIGESKAHHRIVSNYKNITETLPVSYLVHSYEYKDEVLRTARDLGRFVFERGVRDMTKIPFDLVEKWFINKIDKEITRDTLRNYLAHINKLIIAFEIIAESEGRSYSGVSKEDMKVIHKLISSMDRNDWFERSYINPALLISWLPEKEHIVGTIQYKYGLRIKEAAHIKLSQLDGTTLKFKGKGGFELTKELTSDLVEKIIEHMVDGVFKVNQNTYRKNLEKACYLEGEKYNGSHGLRYNYAQDFQNKKYWENIAAGMSYLDAEKLANKQTSEEIGHRRADITMHYLG